LDQNHRPASLLFSTAALQFSNPYSTGRVPPCVRLIHSVGRAAVTYYTSPVPVESAAGQPIGPLYRHGRGAAQEGQDSHAAFFLVKPPTTRARRHRIAAVARRQCAHRPAACVERRLLSEQLDGGSARYPNG
jgi:hypothetical protein